MKRLFFQCLAFSFTLSLTAQLPSDKLFDKYSGKEGFTSVYISKYMFDMFRNLESNSSGEKDEMEEVINKLNCIKIIAADDESGKKPEVNFYKEIMDQLSPDKYKELMVIKESDQEIKFLIREEKNKVSELLMIIGGTEDNVLISIQGDLDMKNIAKLSKSLNIDGMENLEKIENKK